MSQPDEVKAVAPCDKSSISGHREGQDAQRPAHELFDKTDNSYLQSDHRILWIIVERYRCWEKYLQKVFTSSLSLTVVFLFHLLFFEGEITKKRFTANCFLWKHGRRITGDDLLFFYGSSEISHRCFSLSLVLSIAAFPLSHLWSTFNGINFGLFDRRSVTRICLPQGT